MLMMMNALLRRSSQLEQTQRLLFCCSFQAPRSVVSLRFFIPVSLFKGFSRSSLSRETGPSPLGGSGPFKCCPHAAHQHLFLQRFNTNALKNKPLLGFLSAADRRMTSQPKWDTRPRGWESADPVRRRRPISESVADLNGRRRANGVFSRGGSAP